LRPLRAPTCEQIDRPLAFSEAAPGIGLTYYLIRPDLCEWPGLIRYGPGRSLH